MEDRQQAEERARRGQGVPRQEATALQPRNGKAVVPLEEIVSTLDDLDRQRAEARARQRASDTPEMPPSRKRRSAQQEGLPTPPPSEIIYGRDFTIPKVLLSYRKHVKGYIVVFPNNVDDLVATVLPHPLLRTIENIHVSWNGPNRPSPAKVGILLQVRKSRITSALLWLQRNNPLYKDIKIDRDKIQGWQYTEGSTVPAVLMERMQKKEPSVVEKTYTNPIVPHTDRGLGENSFTSIKELFVSLRADPNDDSHPSGYNVLSERPHPLPEDLYVSAPIPESANQGGDVLYKTSTSGMFPLDGPAAFAKVEKLSFLTEAIQTSRVTRDDDAEPSAMMVDTAGDQPFIRVKRGTDFADNLHENFFPRTFPKLFP
ncbi:hypothetical protein DL771_008900 [Monosporascus sp. 5C6A]|nr:hypothetical protein DL771_008900 [Monosporascus sp. 5C6A]